jgi:hypothetical protein
MSAGSSSKQLVARTLVIGVVVEEGRLDGLALLDVGRERGTASELPVLSRQLAEPLLLHTSGMHSDSQKRDAQQQETLEARAKAHDERCWAEVMVWNEGRERLGVRGWAAPAPFDCAAGEYGSVRLQQVHSRSQPVILQLAVDRTSARGVA